MQNHYFSFSRAFGDLWSKYNVNKKQVQQSAYTFTYTDVYVRHRQDRRLLTHLHANAFKRSFLVFVFILFVFCPRRVL